MANQPTWPRRVLQAAAIYHLLWGAWVILFPHHWFDLTGIDRPNYPGIWQCVGMIVGVYGLGYWWASRDFAKHWPVIAVGFLGKIFGPIGFLQSAIEGTLPWSWGWMILTNDLIWWVPFGAMLYLGFKSNSDPTRGQAQDTKDDWSLSQANELAKTAHGQSIAELSSKQEVLLVFLRHAGCTFCRETLDELKKARQQWQSRSLLPVVVHMGSVEQGLEMMKKFGLEDCPVISDPDCRLFRAYQLPRGTWQQLFGMRVWIEGFKAAILKGYGFGKLVGDGFQMSGAFVIRHGQIVRAYPSKDAADSCSWKPALSACLLIAITIMGLSATSALAQNAIDETSTNSKERKSVQDIQIADVKDGDQVRLIQDRPEATESLVLDVQSMKGIGSFKLIKNKGRWPDQLTIRLHTKGLEQIQLIIGDRLRTYSGEFNSTRLQESWAEIFEDKAHAGESKTTSKQITFGKKMLRVMDQVGKEVESVRLPLEQGQYFQWTVPTKWLTDESSNWVEIKWVDFYRN
ncbi:MAG: SelL-related redox protein [Planctomycetota bacterium]